MLGLEPSFSHDEEFIAPYTKLYFFGSSNVKEILSLGLTLLCLLSPVGERLLGDNLDRLHLKPVDVATVVNFCLDHFGVLTFTEAHRLRIAHILDIRMRSILFVSCLGTMRVGTVRILGLHRLKLFFLLFSGRGRRLGMRLKVGVYARKSICGARRGLQFELVNLIL